MAALNDTKKDQIVRFYTLNLATQEELAQQLDVSRRTIYRVLLERGVITPRLELTPKEERLIEAARNNIAFSGALSDLCSQWGY